MIPRSELAHIGVLAKPHGIKGEISAHVDAGLIDILEDAGYVFVDVDGLMVPFTLTSTRPKGAETMLLSLKGVDSQEMAAGFTGKDLWIENSFLPDDDEEDQEGFYLDDLVGFTVMEQDREIGRIDDFDDSTDNLLFSVITPDGRILIPATADFIEQVDTDRRTIYMNLPQGLLNI